MTRSSHKQAVAFAVTTLSAMLIVLGGQHGWAGSLNEGVYTSSFGYVVRPPEGWLLVDAANYAVQSEKLPEPLQRSTGKGDSGILPFDALLFDPELEAAETPMIHDSVVIVVVPSIPEVSHSVMASLTEPLKVELGKLFATVELVAANKSTHNAVASLDLEWKVSEAEGGVSGYVLQTLLPGSTRTLIVTCTIDAARYEERKPLCAAVFDSITLND